jgi:hypothetical protein
MLCHENLAANFIVRSTVLVVDRCTIRANNSDKIVGVASEKEHRDRAR